MGMFDRLRRGAGRRSAAGTSSSSRTSSRGPSIDEDHLRSWTAQRRGVEGFVEPPTTVSGTTLLLVAHDGEWTRRRVPDARWAHAFCNRASVPSYDAAVVGVPQRMRDYNHRVAQAEKQARRRALED